MIAKQRKQTKHSLTDERRNKMWHTHAMKYFSAITRNDIQMNLKDIMFFKGKKSILYDSAYIKGPEQTNP